MVKRFFLILCIFLVCLSFVRLALGVNAPINTQELALYIAQNSGSAQSIQSITSSFSDMVSAFDGLTGFLNLDGVSDFLKDYRSDNLAINGLTKAIALIFDFIRGILSFVVVTLLLGIAIVQHAVPLLLGVLQDILLILRIIIALLFGAGVPT